MTEREQEYEQIERMRRLKRLADRCQDHAEPCDCRYYDSESMRLEYARVRRELDAARVRIAELEAAASGGGGGGGGGGGKIVVGHCTVRGFFYCVQCRDISTP